MTLIKSISGIRGTIGGPAGDTLNPLDIVKFTSHQLTLHLSVRVQRTQLTRLLLVVMHVSLARWLRMWFAVR